MLTPHVTHHDAFLYGEAVQSNDRLPERNAQFDINAIIDYSRGMHASRHFAPASITIRNLDPALKERLRIRAAQHGQSMEAEARRILQTALTPQEAPPVRHLSTGFAPALHRWVESISNCLRASRSASRPGSTDADARYQHAIRDDASRT